MKALVIMGVGAKNQTAHHCIDRCLGQRPRLAAREEVPG
jgi:hypothetical protein